MDVFFYILISTFLISLLSFIGVVFLFLKEEFLNKILLILVSFAAGALMGSAFLHLIPEAIAKVGVEEKSLLKIFLFLLLAFCVFFILENFIKWHHHHAKSHPEIYPVRNTSLEPTLKKQSSGEVSNGVYPAFSQDKGGVKHFSYLILVSDAVHNFIDGMIIAASFIVGLPIGIVTSLAVLLHEIPQEIGDFGVLIYCGFKKAKALLLNFLSAIFAILGGITGFLLSERMGESVIFLLPFAAGSFIYIACSDLIPEIKHKVSLQESLIHFFVFLSGIGVMFLIKLF